MSNDAFLVRPRILPQLDAQFRPAVLANRAFRADVKASGRAVPVQIALERSDGSVSRFETEVLPSDHVNAATNFTTVERWLKFLLWSRGGCKIHFAGPPDICARLQQHYHQSATGKFDSSIMGDKIYERPFEVILSSPERLPNWV
jgi:hypothetical protein